MTVDVDAQKFSIFNPVITYEHREFYERIISELNGIFPICNQGKCTAVEISENATEQEQITDLMKRVENFSGQLLEVSKRLFDQFYQAKENFCKSIYSNTAYIKINLMDRNLLERTCDVRWWSLEAAFSECISYCDGVDEELQQLAPIFTAWRDRSKVDDPMTAPLDELLGLIASGVGPLANIAYAKTIRGALGTLNQADSATSGEQGLPKKISDLLERLSGMRDKISFACDRLEDIRSSYTLYRDLVITNKAGFVLASSNVDLRDAVLGLNVSNERWFKAAMAVKDGTEYFAQDLISSAVEPDQESLIYATAVRENSNTNGGAIGAMGVYFDFQGEAQMILNDYIPVHDDNVIEDGWYSFFTNDQGKVIGTSDEAMVPFGNYAHLPRKHRALVKGERHYSYGVFQGAESAIFSAKTDGYLEYEGLGWSSHLVLPKSVIFEHDFSQDESILTADELMHSRLIPEINKETYTKVQDDKESIQLISLNGIVFAPKLGKRGVALGPIFDQITKTGDFATSMMENC